jgi:hypothetical protein
LDDDAEDKELEELAMMEHKRQFGGAVTTVTP